MVVSIGIFSVVITATIGIMLSIVNAQHKAANIQVVQDNVRFGLELMTKEMRTGRNFETLFPVCAPLDPEIHEIHFDATSGRRIYFYDALNLRIMRAKENITPADCDGASGKAVPLSSEDVYIDRYVLATEGTIVGPSDGQPMITISLRARSKDPKVQLQSMMDVQTTVIQRARDLNP